MKNILVVALFTGIAACLVKLAFFPALPGVDLVPPAQAQGIVEWNNTLRIVTVGDNGATTYVWDYAGKTSVRKYYLESGELKMKMYELKN